VQRVLQPPFDGAGRPDHRLADHLPSEHPLCHSSFRAAAANSSPRSIRGRGWPAVDQLLRLKMLSLLLRHPEPPPPRSANPESRDSGLRLRIAPEPWWVDWGTLVFNDFFALYILVQSNDRAEYKHFRTAKPCHLRRRVCRAALALRCGSSRPRHSDIVADPALLCRPDREPPPGATASSRCGGCSGDGSWASCGKRACGGGAILDMVITDSKLR